LSSSEDESEDEDGVDMDEFLAKNKQKNTGIAKSRVSVSSEVFGVFNKKKEYVPRVLHVQNVGGKGETDCD
jgi:hypothetical protein